MFDISEYNNGAVYTDLSDALGQNGINIPHTIRKGGMSVKFIMNNSNYGTKYVQYRLTANEWSIDTKDWQGVDKIPVERSTNFVESGGVEYINNIQYGLIVSLALKLGLQCRYPNNVTYLYGYYLTNVQNPVLNSHSHAKVSSPIFLKEGETIILRANGSGICFIALTDIEESSYTKVVGGYASPNHIYSYTAVSDCYVALSGVYTHTTVDYIGFEFGIIFGTDYIKELQDSLSQINQKDIQQDNKIELQDARIESLEDTIPHDIDVYNGQSAGDYLVSFAGSVGSFKIVAYSNSHFTAQIPLNKNTTYALPFHDVGAYNMAVANANHNIVANYVAGKATTPGSQFYIGSAMRIISDTLQFICPDDNLYLFINLQFSTILDYTGSFYLLEKVETIQEQIDTINQKDAQQDNRIDVLEETVGGDTRFSSKTIYVFGDSITWLGGDNCDGTRSGHEHQGWTEYFKERIKPFTMKSYARSGATLCCFSTSSETTSANYGSPHKDNIVWNQIKRMQADINNGAAQPDYIIIAAGINDAMIINSTDPQSSFYDLNQAFQNALVGTAEDIFNSDISTSFFGSKTPSECDSLLKTIRWIKEACISICPDAQIVLLTPLQAALAPLSIQKQVSDIIEDTGLYISATVINQRKQCGISRLQEVKGVHFTYDNTHTSIIGAKRVGYILAEILKSVFY